MRIAGVREFRSRTAELLGGDEPVMVSRYGKVAGLYLPLEHPDRVPEDLRRDLAAVLGRHLAQLLERRGVTEEEIQADFDAHRRRSR